MSHDDLADKAASRAQGACHILILQLTSFCNIDCSYCYLPNRSSTRRMTVDTLRSVLRQMADQELFAPDVLINWHAGEPLAVGPAHLEAMAREVAEMPGPIRFHQAIQTNATLIDGEFIRVFKQYDIAVGVSIDGPADIHDRHRVTRNGRGTHEAAMRGVRLLRQHGVKFSTISVISAASLERIEEILDFLRGIGSSFIAFNVEEVEGVHRRSSLAGVTHADAVRFWQRLLLKAAALDVPVREIDTGLGYLTGRLRPSKFSAAPGAYLTVSASGDLATFSPELLGQQSEAFHDFILGNVAERRIADLIRDPAARQLSGAIESGIEACKAQCEYFDYCGGGWPSNKYGEHRRFDVAETRMCALLVKASIDAILNLGETPDVSAYYKRCLNRTGTPSSASNAPVA